jgi:hypothetical protein
MNAKWGILEILSQDHEALITIADVARALNIAYSHAHKYVYELINENVLKTKKVGKALTISLDVTRPQTRAYLALIAYKKTQEWQQKDPRATKILEKLHSIRNKFLCAFLHGNRIVFIVPDGCKNKESFKNFRLRKIIEWKDFNAKHYENILILAGAENYYYNGDI